MGKVYNPEGKVIGKMIHDDIVWILDGATLYPARDYFVEKGIICKKCGGRMVPGTFYKFKCLGCQDITVDQKRWELIHSNDLINKDKKMSKENTQEEATPIPVVDVVKNFYDEANRFLEKMELLKKTDGIDAGGREVALAYTTMELVIFRLSQSHEKLVAATAPEKVEPEEEYEPEDED